jgi:glycosyltransferase involved in cell wall biosynthesis
MLTRSSPAAAAADEIVSGASAHAAHPHAPADAAIEYQWWRLQRLPRRDDLYRQRLASRALSRTPTISIVTPLFDTPPDLLDRLLRSIATQSYPYWEHCLVDDGSADGWLAAYLERLAGRDSRIRFLRRPANGGIVAASNDALPLASGEFIGLVDHDDELDPQALFAVASRLDAEPDLDMLYTDFDVVDRGGRHGPGWFLPDWSPELLLTIPFATHFTVYRRSLVETLGGWRSEYEGSQDYDLALRVASVSQRVAHVPQILYHWRRWERSVAANPQAKPYAYESAKRALTDHLRRNGIAARREDGAWIGFHTVRFDIIGRPLVSIVAAAPAGGDLAGVIAAMRALVSAGGYDRCEIVLVSPRADASAHEAASAGSPPVRLVAADHLDAADWAGLANAGAAAADGDHLLFLAGPMTTLAPGGIAAMLEYSQQAPIGVVGAKLFTAGGVPWHTGVVLPRGVPHRVCHEQPLKHYSAVSGACLMTRRAVFDEAGGFRAEADVGFSDYDLCLRLRDRGYRHVVTPLASLRFGGAAPDDGSEARRRTFVRLWGGPLAIDPYYNPNFCQDGACFRLPRD